MQRVGDVGRLVEFEPHVNVVGYDLFEIGDGRFDAIDDGEGGGVGSFGDRDVDCATAVDVGVGGDQICSVLDGSDIAQIDRGSGDWPDGHTEQFSEIAAEGGVGAGDALQLAGPHVTGGHNERRFVDRLDGFFGGDLVLAQLIGIEHDHDGALAPSERRRRGDAGQGGE